MYKHSIVLLLGSLLLIACQPDNPACDQNLSLSLVSMTDAACGTDEGSLTVSSAGGVSPYQYAVDGQSAQSSGTFSQLSAGTYQVRVTDDLGCTEELETQLLSGLSYTQDIQPIITTTCAVSNCHDGSRSVANFKIASNVIARADKIRTRTTGGSMPPSNSGQSLTQAEIDLIACWAEDGGPQ